MSTFRLSLEIADKDLEGINKAHERIILAKPVGSGNPNRVWQSFSPFENNLVTWE